MIASKIKQYKEIYFLYKRAKKIFEKVERVDVDRFLLETNEYSIIIGYDMVENLFWLNCSGSSSLDRSLTIYENTLIDLLNTSVENNLLKDIVELIHLNRIYNLKELSK